MKILRTIGILALAAGLALGGAGSALAQEPPDEPPGRGPHSPGKRGLSGNVTSVETIPGGYLIHLETKQGTFEITANVTTKYMVPGETHGSANLTTFLEIVGDPPEIEGRRVAVLASLTDNVTATAIRLMLIPSPAHHRYMHRVGVVDTFVPGEDGNIIIIDRDGKEHEFKVTDDTIYRPAEIDGIPIAELEEAELKDAITGGYVTVVTKGDPKKEDLVAKAIVLHEKAAE